VESTWRGLSSIKTPSYICKRLAVIFSSRWEASDLGDLIVHVHVHEQQTGSRLP
jgi:hypothetical protein